MKIVDYSKDTMGKDVARLFGEIYPGWSSEDVQRVLYDEKTPLHVATKVAIIKKQGCRSGKRLSFAQRLLPSKIIPK